MLDKLSRNKRLFAHLLAGVFIVLPIEHSFAKEFLSPEEIEKWFNSDDELPTKKVNDGQLTFLKKTPKSNIFHSTIRVNIDQESINNGWVNISQCYKNLDPIRKTVIIYRKNLIKNLQVTSSKNIEQSYPSEKHKLVLINVTKNAELCMKAAVRNFFQNEDGTFTMVNGPFHRKFLDGYFPYHLNLDISYADSLKFLDVIPSSQTGFEVIHKNQTLAVNTIFEGRLRTQFRFKLK